jgi:Carboxypeptidase regulatory-like domain/TonB dependent receptor/TonB-dependent Receptor Plug Domain
MRSAKVTARGGYMQGRVRIALILVCFCISAIPSFSQKITGDIAGDVKDSTGAVVAGAAATAENVNTHLSRSVTASGTGSFRIVELPLGTYKVSVSASGFKTTVTNLEVSPSGLTHANFVLQVGQRTETVEVEAAAPLVELSPNDNSYIDKAKIDSLPMNGRDLNSLIAVTPGVQRTPGGGFLAISINGSRATSNNYLIDGLYNNDRYYGDQALGQPGITGIPAIIFPPEAIEELGIQETPSAEFGVKGGAPINMVMKAGTNALHGDARWVRHTGFGDAANYFDKINGCSTPGSCQPSPLRNMQFGGTLGGPIIKDRTFFYLFYEGQRYAALSTKQYNVPNQDDVAAARAAITAADLSTSPAGENLLKFFTLNPSGAGNSLVLNPPVHATTDSFGIKIDHKLSSTMLLNGRYMYGDSVQSAPSGATPPPVPLPQDMFNSVAPTRVQLAGLSLTWNMRSNQVLESRFGWTRFSQIIKINNKIDPKSLGIDTGPLDPADFGVPYVYLSAFAPSYIGGVQTYPITTAPDQTYDWSEHFSWVKGNHSIKIGGNFQKAYTNSLRNRARTGLSTYGYYPSSTCSDYSNTAACAAIEQLLLGKMDDANRNFGETHRHITQKSLGVYASDDWKIKPRLTVTLGLRYDLNGAVSEKNNIGSNFIPGPNPRFVTLGHGIDRLYNLDKSDFGPRLGLAWDIFGNGKTALRAGYSLTYDVPNFAAIAAPYSFANARSGAFTQPNLGPLSSLGVDIASSATGPPETLGCSNDPAGDRTGFICLDIPVFGPDAGTSSAQGPFNAFSVIRDLKTPRAHNFNISIQHEISKNNVLTIGYSGQRGQDLLLDRDINASPLGGDGTRPFDGQSFQDFGKTQQPFGVKHVIQLNNDARSQYDSLQATLNQRNVHGLNLTTNFTWSKCYDYNSVNRGGAGDYPQANNPYNPKDSYGLCDTDVRLNFNSAGVYTVPNFPALGRWMNGWQVNGIFTAISGRPFTVLLNGGDPSGQGLRGSSIRAAWDGTPVQYNTRNPGQYVAETFTVAGQPDPCGDNTDSDGNFLAGFGITPFHIPCGTIGNSRRNQLIGPGLVQLDMSLIKNTKITERLSAQFRWEVFNVLNRGNFNYLPNQFLDSSFGQLNQTSDVFAGNPVVAQGGPRNMQFALKFVF